MQELCIDTWLENYIKLILKAFSGRVHFIGIQGSYARGEASKKSDIDVVLLLDDFSYNDLKIYDNAIAALDYREKMCGFISGVDEIENWDRADLFQFYYDTKALYGSMEWIGSLIKKADIKRTIHRDACNIYHMCVHNAIHEKSCDVLKSILKASVYLIREKYFYNCGRYVRKSTDLTELADDEDKMILQLWFNDMSVLDLDAASETIMNWTGKIIKEMDL